MRIIRALLQVTACWAATLGMVAAATVTQHPARSVHLDGQPVELPVPAAETHQDLTATAVQVTLQPAQNTAVKVTILSAQTAIGAKVLHPADPTYFATFQPPPSCKLRLELLEAAAADVTVTFWQLGPFRPDSTYVPEREPNDTPTTAQPYQFGQTVVAGAADEPYRFLSDWRDMRWKREDIAEDWYQVRWRGPLRLAYIWIDLLDREIPVDVAVFRATSDGLEELDPRFEKFQPERSTQYVDLYKFRAFLVEPGATYLVRVRARHPAYLLRSALYPVPPYLSGEPADDAALAAAATRAVRVAQDYVLLKGESWHANTPRTGAVANRWRNVHAETAQCIACHPTQFATRGALVSIVNGYRLRRREQLDFLADRLYNNPRPFYGFPDAAWTRVISAAANSLSRPSVTLRWFEDYVSGRPVEAFHRSVAEFLRLYYDGRSRLPSDESNGNRPLVSAYEIALHSWQVFDRLARETGQNRYRALADQVERLIAQDEPVQDMLDLCYQTLAFCRIDRRKYADRIDQNVQRILSFQRPDGRWPMTFDRSAPPAEFQTAHCLYVLAVAGLGIDYPAVRRGVLYLLRHQERFGAWYDDADPKRPHPYENFQTPFRETQFALMALSELFRRKPQTPDRQERPGGPWATAAAALDAIGYEPTDDDLRLLRKHAESPDPLLRWLAVVAAGRAQRPEAAAVAVQALRDQCWSVRRAAAWAVRRYPWLSEVRRAVRDLLCSDAVLLRRAALQVFQQHFRFWTDDAAILAALQQILRADPDPVCRVLAARALWQWWYWSSATSARSGIEDVLIAALRTEKDERVVLNVQEALYNVCDENVRYLYNNWIPSLARRQWREQATAAQRATAARQAKKLAAALEQFPPERRARLLEAIGWFHLRGALRDGGRERRIGNDVETVRFYGEAGRAFAQQLKPLLASDEPLPLRRAAVLAALSVRDTAARAVVGPEFIGRLADEDPALRAFVGRFAAQYLPQWGEPVGAEWLQAAQRLLNAPWPRAQGMGLRLTVAAARQGKTAEQNVATLLKAYFRRTERPAPDALLAVAALPSLERDRRIQRHLRRALRDEDRKRATAAVRVILSSPALRADERFRRPLDEFGRRLIDDPQLWSSVLREAAEVSALARDPHVATWVAEALASNETAVRATALDTIRKRPELRTNAAVRAALQRLLRSAEGRTLLLARKLYGGDAGQEPVQEVPIEQRLDFEFFRRFVQPIFFAIGPDGQACVDCHLNHGILNLQSPKEGLDPEQVARHNYRSTLRVVDLAEPEQSLLLRKPLSDAATEGIVGGGLSHGGDVRWPERKRSRAYQLILQWLNGAKAEP